MVKNMVVLVVAIGVLLLRLLVSLNQNLQVIESLCCYVAINMLLLEFSRLLVK